jgi:hypothetical protein
MFLHTLLPLSGRLQQPARASSALSAATSQGTATCPQSDVIAVCACTAISVRATVIRLV